MLRGNYHNREGKTLEAFTGTPKKIPNVSPMGELAFGSSPGTSAMFHDGKV